MKIKLRLFGRDVLILDVDPGGQLQPVEPPAQPEPAAPAPPQPAPAPEPFGFWGGAGGTQEHNWQPDVHRPLEADR